MRPDTSDDVRGLFHSLVFLRASQKRLRQILTSDWNTRSRLHLYHYRDKEHQPVSLPIASCSSLRACC
jgi:hypothetical protein